LARKAVAATLASVLLLTALVLADATIVSAQDNLASSAQASLIETRESVLDQSLSGSVALQALSQVQAYLSSNPASCDGIPGYLASISSSSSTSGEGSGIVYSVNATAASMVATTEPPGAQGLQDNLTILSPFSGYLPGALNLRADLRVKEVGGGGSVTLERREIHVLHLPISPGSASSLCASALGSLAVALSRSSCNATLAQAAFDSAMPRLVEEASALGFSLTAGWELGSGAGCPATYQVMLVELGVAGVTGTFDWTVRGSGTTA
jgi:hypothetical protein